MISRFVVLTLLLGSLVAEVPVVPSQEARTEPVLGVHTIRADDALLQLAFDGGFTWLVQLIEWREIEPVPGEYFWEYVDWLARAAEYYGLDLVLRLDHPPEWALSREGTSPVSVPTYAEFVARVAARFRGKVAAYVIWNEPNLASEWGEHAPDPASYVEMLCAAQSAIRSADPKALVISAGLAPTNHADVSALDDRQYLRAMYSEGASACFDVLGAHPYGFAYPPNDPPGAHDGLNYARLAELRAIMVEHGDEDKPIWATEAGWSTEAVAPAQQWLQVSEEEQERFLVEAVQRAAVDWPWLERIAIWNLSTGLAADDEKRGYSILTGDGRPKPAYEALAAMGKERKQQRSGQQETGGTVEILAPDVVVRLSDVDTFYPHWARPHCASVPCRQWTGQFYVSEPGTTPWQLRMEIMQVEEPGNLVQVNGYFLVPPAIPLRGRPDFASVWSAAEMPIPADLLRPGVNTIEIHSSPRMPVYQDDHAHYESLQFRHIRLVPTS